MKFKKVTASTFMLLLVSAVMAGCALKTDANIREADENPAEQTENFQEADENPSERLESSGNNFSPVTDRADEPIDPNFGELCKKIDESGYQAGMAYIGPVDFLATEEEMRSYLENSPYAEAYVFLCDAPLLDAGGTELYAVVTTGEDRSASVYPAEINENGTYDVHADRALYEGKGKDCFLLRCNPSELHSNVSILFRTGDERFEIFPMLSGKDGRLDAMGLYDFSIYATYNMPENQWTDTSWQAERYKVTEEGQVMEGNLPETDWTVELYLMEGGAARYREWKPGTFDYIGACHLLLGIRPDCFWYPDSSGGFLLSTEPGRVDEDAVFAKGHMEGSQLVLDVLGNRFWMEQQPMPARGGEYCMADLLGQWDMVSGETVTEGSSEISCFTAGEMEISRRLIFHSSWDGTEPNGVDYYDEWHPGYLRQALDMTAEYQKLPIYEGCGNEAWRLQLFSSESIFQNYAEENFYVTVMDADTLLFQIRLKDTDGIWTTSTQIFQKAVEE